MGALGLPEGILGVAEAARRALAVLATVGIRAEQLSSLRDNHTEPQFLLSLVNADQTGEIFVRHNLISSKIPHVGFWAWELEDFPHYLSHATTLVDEIWVNSSFARDSIEKRTKIPVKVFPIPAKFGFQNKIAKPKSEAFTFLTSFDYHSDVARKNPYATVAAFKLAFGESDKVRLVVKSHNSGSFSLEHRELIETIGGSSNIFRIDEAISAADYENLLANSDCFVSLHRSEGLGLNILDAMALGIPTISTGYSGNLDFQTEENSLLVKYSMTKLNRYGPWPLRSTWAEPSLVDAAEKMVSMFEEHDLRKSIASRARGDIETQRTLVACGSALVEMMSS